MHQVSSDLSATNRMKLVSFQRSDNPDKKYKVQVEISLGHIHTIHFGDAHLKDYTLYPATEREDHKRRYLARHHPTEHWSDPSTEGFWSRWILWNKPTVSASLADTRLRFGL